MNSDLIKILEKHLAHLAQNTQDGEETDVSMVLAQTIGIPYTPGPGMTLAYLNGLIHGVTCKKGLVYLMKKATPHTDHAACEAAPIAIGDGYAVLTLKSATNVDLPQDISVRLSEWMDMYLGLHSYSCAGFLYYMMTGKPYPPPRGWESFSSGQRTTYLLLTETTPKSVLQNFHFALYIPQLHLYLSQFGNGGEIVVCGLDEMHKFFKTDKVTYIDRMEPMYKH